jgi:hypothetical protein
MKGMILLKIIHVYNVKINYQITFVIKKNVMISYKCHI